jgi:hypothetical protein
MPSDRTPRRRKRAEGSGSFLGNLGIVETGTGMQHGPSAILLAVVAALIIYPLTRFVRWLTRR